MSGDVQPRKRKDKRRKKEGTSLGSIHEPVISHKYKRSESDDLKIFDVPDQGEKIHVQNEHGVGGNICVKIIFFCLFGLLIGAVGLIYMKSQGSTDVDLPTIEESRFAEYFTGWLDDSTDDHEHEAHENHVDHDEHEEHDEHDEQEEHDDHEDHDEEDDEHENEEEDHILEQDAIFRLFGLQGDEADEVEESEVKSKELHESESRHTHDVDEDEDEEEEEEDEKEETEEEEEEDEKDRTEEEEEEDEKDRTEEEEEEEEEEEKNDVDDTEEVKNEEEEEEENERNDSEEEEDEVGKDDDSGVDLNEQDDDDDDDEDEDLSQMDEEDEDKYEKKSKEESATKSKGKIHDDDEDDDDGDDGSEEKQHSTEEPLDDKADDLDGSEEMEKEEKEDGESAEKEDSKSKVDTDDLGFDEIEVSEEDLGTEDDTKAEHGDENLSKEASGKSLSEEHTTSQKMKQLESGIQSDDEEAEEETEDVEGGGGVAVKLGVGIALIIVAHLVLVKKWKSMTNAPTDVTDENVPSVAETPAKKKEIENLQATPEPVISRRQTLVPENVTLNGEPDEEEEEEVEDEEEEEEEEEAEVDEEEDYAEDDEVYFEEGKYKNVKDDNRWEKPWNAGKGENEEEDDLDNEEEAEYEEELEEEDGEEVEDEQEEEEEEEVDDDEEEYEEDVDDEVDDDKDVLKQKLLAAVPDKRQEEVQETAPTPPPRSRGGRGAQEFDEGLFDFEGVNHFEETRGDEVNGNSFPEEEEGEEEKTPEKKVGNEEEWSFRQEFDFADEQLENNPKAALDVYDKIIAKKPTMLRALIGRAKALDQWAEKEKSNTYLKQAINAYKTVLFDHGERLDDETYVKLAERCIERMRFAGNFISAVDIHKALILKYPNTPKYRNTLAVTYLMLNKIPQARVLLNETLSLWPKNGFALVHYGFILKTSDNNMEEGAKKLMAGIQTREEGVIDGMFFFHLGDALNRLGREKEAMTWYELGVKEGLFLSKYQRSLYNVNRLKGQPWWTKEETTYQDFFKKLEENWREIRREGLELLNSKGINLFKEEAENLKDTGDWKQLDLYFRGRKQANCNKAPITCALVSSFKPASTCTRGQIKFSVMLPNTHVWPHCGPTNCRLRSHLGLVVPKKTFIRVAEETRSWEEGKFIIFDDSFEHEVWHNGTGLRLVLIVDVWHPELSSHERRVLSPI